MRNKLAALKTHVNIKINRNNKNKSKKPNCMS